MKYKLCTWSTTNENVYLQLKQSFSWSIHIIRLKVHSLKISDWILYKKLRFSCRQIVSLDSFLVLFIVTLYDVWQFCYVWNIYCGKDYLKTVSFPKLLNRHLDQDCWVSHCFQNVQIRSFSGPYFSIIKLNAGVYRVNLCIQSGYWKIWTRKNSIFDY